MDGRTGGWLQVELFSAAGQPVSGHELDGCDTIRGNGVRKVITWQGKSERFRIGGQAGPTSIRHAIQEIVFLPIREVRPAMS